MIVPPVKRRMVALKWVERLFRDLTDKEKQDTISALGGLMLDEYSGTVDHLWERYQHGRVGCYMLNDEAGNMAAVTFFEVVELHDGSLCFESLCTVAAGPTARSLTDKDMEQMEALARSIAHPSGKRVTSMAMSTPRHGLVKQLIEKHGWYASYITVRKIF